MTLVEFLRARLAERKREAKEALVDGSLELPAVVLSDIAVKLEIIRCYEELLERRDHFRELGFKTGATGAGLESYEHVLRCWAQQDDDHPDYSTDWWPQWGPMRPREVQPS